MILEKANNVSVAASSKPTDYLEDLILQGQEAAKKAGLLGNEKSYAEEAMEEEEVEEEEEAEEKQEFSENNRMKRMLQDSDGLENLSDDDDDIEDDERRS